MIKMLLTAALIATTPVPALAGDQPVLTLRFANVKAHQGMVMIAIYDEAGWGAGKPVRVAVTNASGAEVQAAVTGLAPGRYGVKVFHDVDGDGKMSTNPFGMPIEPFGFSRDAVGVRGAPAWADAAFDVAAGDTAQTITLR